MSVQEEEKSPFRRVKLYHLNDEGKWDDKGTGHVKIVPTLFGTHTIIVHSEEDGSVILESKVCEDDIYQRQGETLIVWCDPDSGIDMALSFQEDQGCQEIWTEISNIQGIDPNRPMSEDDDDYDGGVSPNENFFHDVLTLPEPQINNLEEIQKVLSNVSPAFKHQLSASINQEYIDKLVDIFKQCEDLEDIAKLRILFEIFKNTVLLNDKALISTLLSDEYVYPVMGALEYDPELPVTRAKHRDFLKNNVSFKQVGEFSEPVVLSKIHQNYRITYLKDSVLPRALDDPTFNTLNVMIYMNNIEIIDNIQNDDKFLTSLFSKFESSDISKIEIRDAVKFLQELSNLLKNMQAETKAQFYRSLTEHGLFRVMQKTLTDSDVEIRQSTSDIIGISLNHNTNLLRSFILTQQPHYTFFSNLCKQVINETDIGIKEQLGEVIKVLLENDTFESVRQLDYGPNQPSSFSNITVQDRNEFIETFYDRFISILVAPLTSDNFQDSTDLPREVVNATIVEVCDLLAYFIQQHSYRSKFHILRNNILSHVTKLLQAESKHIQLAAIRVLRSCVGLKEEFYNKHLIKFELFEPVIGALKRNINKYNMVNSAILELFDFIRKENIKNLIAHLVDKYRDLFKTITYVETFQLLILKHDQNTEPAPTIPKPKSSETPYRRTIFDTDEERYFSQESLDQDTANAKGIVDYADEEELTDSSTSNSNNSNTDSEPTPSPEEATNGAESGSSTTTRDNETGEVESATPQPSVNGETSQVGVKRTLDDMSGDDQPVQSEGKKRRLSPTSDDNV